MQTTRSAVSRGISMGFPMCFPEPGGFQDLHASVVFFAFSQDGRGWIKKQKIVKNHPQDWGLAFCRVVFGGF